MTPDHAGPTRIDVAIQTERLPGSEAEVVAACERALRATGLPGAVSLALVDDAAMRAVNRDYHDCDETTDVLAFPLGIEGMPTLGDAFDFEIVVCVETAFREAAARDVDPLAEVLLYLVHGSLHLLGFDDHDPEDARRMHVRTLEILSALGYDNQIEVGE